MRFDAAEPSERARLRKIDSLYLRIASRRSIFDWKIVRMNVDPHGFPPPSGFKYAHLGTREYTPCVLCGLCASLLNPKSSNTEYTDGNTEAQRRVLSAH